LGLPVHSIDDIEKALAAARRPDAGLVVMSDAFLFLHRHEIAKLAARHRLPSVYFSREWVEAGGLVSYGPGILDTYRHAPAYIDPILRGARPSELPVQEPTKLELIVNLKAAKALGLTIPASLLARADEVID